MANFVSTGPNQFLIRAQNGVAINTNAPEVGAALTVAGNAVVQSPGALSFGSATRQMLNLFGTSYGIGVQSDTQYFRSGGNGYFAWFRGGVHSNAGLDPGAGGSLLMTLGPAASTPTGTARAQSFTNVSDRASKTGFEPIDASDVLARVTQLPLSQWSYRNEPSACATSARSRRTPRCIRPRRRRAHHQHGRQRRRRARRDPGAECEAGGGEQRASRRSCGPA
ncbi:MAG: tail fiber domain-containing protein [Xanthomonadales bacterium]|nr:tail fiber domain-containing protein [Xanthomonadales bacterium]